MKLIFVRHCEPDYSIDSLTEKGWREAEYLTERLTKLPITKIYCSPLGRAKDTAKGTLEKLGMTAEICEWLREFTGTVMDPRTNAVRHSWDLYPNDWLKDECHFDKALWKNSDLMQSGNVSEKYDEVSQGIDEILEKHGYKRENNFYRAIKSNNDTIVFFCHFAVEAVILSHILNISPLAFWHGFVALPSSVTTVITEEREEGIAYFRCNGFGDTSHLYANDEPLSFMARFCESFYNDEERH